MIEAEKQAETARILRRVASEDRLDLEAVEFYVRSAMLAAGATVLERLLHDAGVGRQEKPRMCCKGHLPRKMRSAGVREKTVETILGPVRFGRSRLVCPACGAVEYPGDAELGIEGTGFSPGMRRLMTRAGSRESFAQGAEDLFVYGAIKVGAKDVERIAEGVGRVIDDWMRRRASQAMIADGEKEASGKTVPILYVSMDGTGTPMRPGELEGRKGKGPDGRARTREVKLGCVFTQTTLDEQDRPVRDPASTTYVGAIESSADFGARLHAEAVRRGLRRAEKTVMLTDGAEYNATIAREYFPGAVHIIDLYHARERLSDFVKDHTSQPAGGDFHRRCEALLDEGLIEEMSERMTRALPSRGERRKEGLGRIAYFVARKEQMRYGQFRRQGWFVGSGVIEAGCKTLIGKRLKQSGMFWSVAGANAIIAARCCIYSGRFEQFWEDTGT